MGQSAAGPPCRAQRLRIEAPCGHTERSGSHAASSRPRGAKVREERRHVGARCLRGDAVGRHQQGLRGRCRSCRRPAPATGSLRTRCRPGRRTRRARARSARPPPRASRRGCSGVVALSWPSLGWRGERVVVVRFASERGQQRSARPAELGAPALLALAPQVVGHGGSEAAESVAARERPEAGQPALEVRLRAPCARGPPRDGGPRCAWSRVARRRRTGSPWPARWFARRARGPRPRPDARALPGRPCVRRARCRAGRAGASAGSGPRCGPPSRSACGAGGSTRTPSHRCGAGTPSSRSS